MGHEVRHYWHSNIPNAPKDGENVPGSKAPSLSCSPSWRRMRDFGSAGRWIPKISVSSELFPSQAVERVNTTIRLKLFSLRLFLFRPEARPSSSVWKAGEYVFILPSPKSRLLNYYFPGSRDRSQWTRPAFFCESRLKEPLGCATASAKVSTSICPFIQPPQTRYRHLQVCEMWAENLVSL